ncbi:putative leucine-rich repeat-containing protein DDB_G0290503 isoform X2 [Trichoplusia ni]|uniref:Leucine-rich repeat-containing protein DDB_G0290503 isoform X2 n=1 Tax=Trichoplusia ni TaxID=7111 RepID=A0A7E5X5N8_TRINI|nr:putative leucine-rich repeat-containing protein DDB_G0290503 isoform X2 [Trichoplusia ni]
MSTDPDKATGYPNANVKSVTTEFSEIGDKTCGDEVEEKKNVRTVRFPDEDQIVTQYFEPANPWQDVPTTTRSQLAAEYLESCRRHDTPCLDGVLEQIRELPESSIGGATRAPRLTLAECSLSGTAPADALESIMRRVQFRRLELEHAGVDDEGAEAIFDMVEYYESATVLCISGPRMFGIRGWQAASRMIKKSAELSELEVRDAPLEASHAPVLARSLRAHTCRLRALCLQRVALAGEPLLCLVIALKSNSSIRELRLGDNRLSVTDAAQLASLLRYNSRIQLLDLSNNQIQDAGVAALAEALSEQAALSPPSSDSRCLVGNNDSRGLAFLVLWNNQLTRNCAPYLSKALRSSQSLCVLNIGRNAVGSETVRAVPRGAPLVSLGLQAARLGPDAAPALADLVRAHGRLQRLDLRENRLGAAGLQAILTALKENNTLTQIDLDEPPDSSSLLAEDNEAALVRRVTREIRALCRRNEPTKPEDDTTHPVHRKISLTCHTACLLRGMGGGEEERRGGRLRSPAPSPAPSPAGSPVPAPHPHSRFMVTRVTPERDSSTDSSSSTSSTPTRPYCPPSRFRVVQVLEPPQIQVHPASSQPRKSPSRFSVTRNYDSVYNPTPSPPPPSPAPSIQALDPTTLNDQVFTRNDNDTPVKNDTLVHSEVSTQNDNKLTQFSDSFQDKSVVIQSKNDTLVHSDVSLHDKDEVMVTQRHDVSTQFSDVTIQSGDKNVTSQCKNDVLVHSDLEIKDIEKTVVLANESLDKKVVAQSSKSLTDIVKSEPLSKVELTQSEAKIDTKNEGVVKNEGACQNLDKVKIETIKTEGSTQNVVKHEDASKDKVKNEPKLIEGASKNEIVVKNETSPVRKVVTTQVRSEAMRQAKLEMLNQSVEPAPKKDTTPFFSSDPMVKNPIKIEDKKTAAAIKIEATQSLVTDIKSEPADQVRNENIKEILPELKKEVSLQKIEPSLTESNKNEPKVESNQVKPTEQTPMLTVKVESNQESQTKSIESTVKIETTSQVKNDESNKVITDQVKIESKIELTKSKTELTSQIKPLVIDPVQIKTLVSPTIKAPKPEIHTIIETESEIDETESISKIDLASTNKSVALCESKTESNKFESKESVSNEAGWDLTKKSESAIITEKNLDVTDSISNLSAQSSSTQKDVTKTQETKSEIDKIVIDSIKNPTLVKSDLKYSDVLKSDKKNIIDKAKVVRDQIIDNLDDNLDIDKMKSIDKSRDRDSFQNVPAEVILKKNKSESSLDSPDLEVSRLMQKRTEDKNVFDSNSSLEISGSSMESLNEQNKSVQELDRRKSVILSNESSVESTSDVTPVNSGNFLNLSLSSNESVSPLFGKTKLIHDSLSSLEASVSSLDSGKIDKIMVTSADSGIEYSLQHPSENRDDNSSNEGTLTNNSSLKESMRKPEVLLESISSPKRTSSLLDVPALKSKGLDRMRKISWVAPSSSFHVPRAEEKEAKPSHLEKLLSLFQHPASIFSRSLTSDDEKKTSSTPPRKDSSLTSSFWSWGSTIERERDDSEATDSTLSERVQVSFVDESFSKKLDSKTPSTDTDNTLSEFQSFPQESEMGERETERERERETVTITTEDIIVQNLDVSVINNANRNEIGRENRDEREKEIELVRPRSFAAVLKASGSENSLDKQSSPDNGQSVEKLPSKVIRGIKENISPENTLTSSMSNTKALAVELERQVKNPDPVKIEPRIEDKIQTELLAPIATIEETCDVFPLQLAFIDEVNTEKDLEQNTEKSKEIDLGKDALSYLVYDVSEFRPEKPVPQSSLAQELRDAEIKEILDLSPELVVDELQDNVFAPKEIIKRTSPIIPERAKIIKSNSLEDLSITEEKVSPKTKTIAFKVPESTTPRDIPERRAKLRTRSGSSPKSLPESLNKPCPLTKMESILSKKKKKVSSLGKMARDSLLALNMSEEEIAEFRRSYKLTSVESLKSLESVSEDANSQSGNSIDSRCRACLRTSQESLMSLDSISEDCRCAEDCERPGKSAR